MAVRELEVPSRPSGTDPAGPRGFVGALWHRLVYPFRRGNRPAPQPPTGFYTDTTVCIGCKACEVACKQWNQLPADGFSFTANSYDNTGALTAESWRHVKFIEQFPTPEPITAPPSPTRFELNVLPAPAAPAPGYPDFSRWLMMSDVCKHCAAAPCQQACPTGAIVYNEFANVYIQADICNGCAYCVAACPFGVVTRSHFDGHAHKCTLCYDRQRDGLVPACAKACPTASIQFGPVADLRARAEKRVEDLNARGVSAYLYGAKPTDTYTELHSFYLLVDRPEVYGLPAEPVNPWVHMRGDYLRAVGTGLVALGVLITLLLTGN
ncbi:Formate dehydrogenase, nitrate-inducible, iron-sulfur subunit [Gemmata sp. SH-PL17]|uniref:4Fe-4S dicluster domain-containing protein n=1 Tax=Gemmata sp. SH-PL17 TaxID=1630693 RepID=UPI00078D3BCD|nr:4Fe-4S dicluster domain-containing protein [Gemmata sp. SH-PL17]AMV25149.1 Formate dehydrogenase, nitrate-inducible, iron-sulfur subunit [Gemmata sp. SH-PL17]